MTYPGTNFPNSVRPHSFYLENSIGLSILKPLEFDGCLTYGFDDDGLFGVFKFGSLEFGGLLFACNSPLRSVTFQIKETLRYYFFALVYRSSVDYTYQVRTVPDADW